MNIVEFFDPHNPKHVVAYKTMQDTGEWPCGFVPKGTEFPVWWDTLILNKLANCWVEYQLQIARGDRW